MMLETEEELDAPSSEIQHSAPPIFSRIREAGAIAKRFQLDLPQAQVRSIVEESYLQAGHEEYIGALGHALSEIQVVSPWRDHLDNVLRTLSLALVARTVCILREPSPADPRLEEALGRHMTELAEKSLAKSSSH